MLEAQAQGTTARQPATSHRSHRTRPVSPLLRILPQVNPGATYAVSPFAPQMVVGREMSGFYVERLARGLPGKAEADLEDKGQRIGIGLVGCNAPDGETLWRMKRTINLAAGEIHCDGTFVGLAQRRKGIAKAIMRNTVALASDLEFRGVTIFAVGDGRYVWAREGFSPVLEEWVGNLRPSLLRTLNSLSTEISSETMDTASRFIESDDPAMIRAIARLNDIVGPDDMGHHDPSGRTLGYALLMEAPGWHGARSVPAISGGVRDGSGSQC